MNRQEEVYEAWKNGATLQELSKKWMVTRERIRMIIKKEEDKRNGDRTLNKDDVIRLGEEMTKGFTEVIDHLPEILKKRANGESCNECKYSNVQSEDEPCRSCIDYDKFESGKKLKITKNDILEQAKTIINGDRQGIYGDAEDSFSAISDLWSAYLCNALQKSIDISREDVANMMILMKVARNSSGVYKEDNWIDICGYAALGGEIGSKKINRSIEVINGKK